MDIIQIVISAIILFTVSIFLGIIIKSFKERKELDKLFMKP
jgi:hypothetical protein